jgi:hypothetical protein
MIADRSALTPDATAISMAAARIESRTGQQE